MAITQAMCTSFKDQILEAVHDFRTSGGDVFKIALYSSAATLDATTTAYTSSNEVANSGTYAAGGGTLTNISPTTSGTTAFADFDDISFTSATINARGALIYNSTEGNKSVAVLDFGADKTVSNDTFQIIFPTADATSAIVRIS